MDNPKTAKMTIKQLIPFLTIIFTAIYRDKHNLKIITKVFLSLMKDMLPYIFTTPAYCKVCFFTITLHEQNKKRPHQLHSYLM